MHTLHHFFHACLAPVVIEYMLDLKGLHFSSLHRKNPGKHDPHAVAIATSLSGLVRVLSISQSYGEKNYTTARSTIFRSPLKLVLTHGSVYVFGLVVVRIMF